MGDFKVSRYIWCIVIQLKNIAILSIGHIHPFNFLPLIWSLSRHPRTGGFQRFLDLPQDLRPDGPASNPMKVWRDERNCCCVHYNNWWHIFKCMYLALFESFFIVFFCGGFLVLYRFFLFCFDLKIIFLTHSMKHKGRKSVEAQVTTCFLDRN